MKRAATSYERIYAAVRTIPPGRVTTYGAIARIAGLPGRARLVGHALSALRPATAVPWHRVINAQGEISLELAGSPEGVTQRLRLEGEGVRVNAAGRVALDLYGWRVKATSRGPRKKKPRLKKVAR